MEMLDVTQELCIKLYDWGRMLYTGQLSETKHYWTISQDPSPTMYQHSHTNILDHILHVGDVSSLESVDLSKERSARFFSGLF